MGYRDILKYLSGIFKKCTVIKHPKSLIADVAFSVDAIDKAECVLRLYFTLSEQYVPINRILLYYIFYIVIYEKICYNNN